MFSRLTMGVKRSLRCRKCDHNLLKPEFSPSSIKFKMHLIATRFVTILNWKWKWIIVPASFLKFDYSSPRSFQQTAFLHKCIWPWRIQLTVRWISFYWYVQLSAKTSKIENSLRFFDKSFPNKQIWRCSKNNVFYNNVNVRPFVFCLHYEILQRKENLPE